jgi:microtubule-associated protein-like 5
VHQRGVPLIAFFNNDEYIASCGLRSNTPVLVYNIKDFTLVLSISISELAVELLTVRNLGGGGSKQQ